MARAKSNILYLLYALLALFILLRLIPFFIPDSRTWGFNHLIFLPSEYTFVFFAVAAAALLMPFVRSSERWGVSLADWFSYKFFESRRKYIYRLVFIVCTTILFVIFAAPTHFLGDGYVLIENFASSESVITKWSEFGAVKLIVFLQSLVGPSGKPTTILTFQAVSIVSGFMTVWFLFPISNIASTNRIKKLLLFLTAFFSGTLLLFFGYVEYYHLAWLFMVAFIYYGLRFIKEGRGLPAAWIFLLLGMIMHLMMFIFLPAAVYLTVSADPVKRVLSKYKGLRFILFFVLPLAAIIAFIYKLSTDLYIQDMLLMPFRGKMIDPDYAIFSINHIIDIFNEFYLVSPFFFILLAVSAGNLKAVFGEKITTFLAISAISGLCFVLVIDPKLTMPRDWDLFSICAFPATLILILLAQRRYSDYLGRLMPSVILYLIISPLPFLLTNLNRERSIHYTEYIISLDTQKSYSIFYIMRKYYEEQGDTQKLDSMRLVQNTIYTDMRNRTRALEALMRGDYNEAMSVIPLIKKDKFNPEYHRIHARFNFMSGNYVLALDHANKALQLRKYISDYYWERAVILAAMGEKDKAMADLRKGYGLNPSTRVILTELAMMYADMGKYDSSIYYGEKRFEIDSLSPDATYALAESYAMTGELIKSNELAKKYAQFVKSNPSLYAKFKNLVGVLKNQKEVLGVE